MNTLQIGGEIMKTLEQANDLVAQLVAENTKLRQDAAKLADDLDEQKIIAGNWKFRASTALKRLAEIEKQEPVAYFDVCVNGDVGAVRFIPHHGEPLKSGDKLYAAAGASPVEPSESVEFAKLEPVYFSQFSGCGLEEVSKDRYDEIAEDDRITYYTSAGASLVATPIVAWAKSTPRKLRITTMDMGGEDGWRPLGYTAAGASPVEPKEVIKEIVVRADYREMWRQQLKMNQQLNAGGKPQSVAASD